MNRTPDDARPSDRSPVPAAEPGASGAVLVAHAEVAEESRAEVALARGLERLTLQVVSAKRDIVELQGPIFLPRRCRLSLRLDLGGTPTSLEGTVRKAHLVNPEPTYALSVQLDLCDRRVLEQLAEVTAANRGRVVKAVPAVESSTFPGWAARLVAHAVVTERQLEEALARGSGMTLGDALVQAGVVDQETLALFMNMELGVPYVDPRMFDIRLTNCATIPESLARRHRIFPLFRVDGVVTLGMADPTDLALVDQVRLRENCHVDPCLCTSSALDSLIDRAYSASGAGPASAARQEPERPVEETAEPSNNKVVRLVQSMIEEATRTGASDIHVEPERDLLRIRTRVDGILREQAIHARSLHAPVVSRIKVAAKLDIAETRRPQDGHFGLKVDQRDVDVRVSTIPTVHGENVVLRLSLSDGKAISLDELGMAPKSLAKLKHYLDHPHGMILVTGPTGSGKTTTLYAALGRLNTLERNVVTVEDPVEKRLPLLRQTQVSVKSGLTFAVGLRSILRQDPDVLMVGEIRDRETAEISVQAALTGHLLLSTLHTNTASGAVVRLSEMGIPPFLITSSLRAVIAQRLVRRICDNCKREVTPDPVLALAFGLDAGARVMGGAGCARCLHTGFRSRVGIYELLEITPGLGRALLSGASRDTIEQEAALAVDGGLWQDGVRRVREGFTTLEEVARVVGVPQVEAR